MSDVEPTTVEPTSTQIAQPPDPAPVPTYTDKDGIERIAHPHPGFWEPAQVEPDPEDVAAADARNAEETDAGTGPFDPSAHTVPQVQEHLATADEIEAQRVLDAEAADKARVGVLNTPVTPAGS